MNISEILPYAPKVRIGGIYYELDANKRTAEVTHGKMGYSGSVVIPQTVEHENATYSVTSIGKSAFCHCYNLERVTIGGSVQIIGTWAFERCSGLKEVEIPGSVTKISELAFNGCVSLAEVTIPASVREIGDLAFCECSSLTAFHVAEENERYCAKDGVLYTKDMTEIIQFPIGKGGSFDIPEGVTHLGNGAFTCHAGLKEVTIPKSVTSIGYWVFADCDNLTHLYSANPTPPSVETISLARLDKSLCTLHVPKGSLETYKAARSWQNFLHMVEY